jgi:hypothetical protein
MDYGEYATQDLRLVLLRSLVKSPSYTSNETVLQLEAQSFGHKRSRDAIRTELRYLADVGALKIEIEKPLMVVILTTRGLDHCEGRAEVEGVPRPSPKA